MTYYVSLPMYDLPALRAATDRWWAAVAAALREAGLERVPAVVERREGAGGGRLLLGQCCGLAWLGRPPLRLVATPVYAAPGCSGPDYRSLIVVRRDDPARKLGDLRGRRAAVNLRRSHSGYNALRYLIAPHARDGRFFSSVLTTGSHAASLQAVAGARADVAAIDCVSYALCVDTDPSLGERLRRLASSPRAPGLPYVTDETTDDQELARLRGGLHAAFADPALASLRAPLRLAGLAEVPLWRYRHGRIAAMRRRAVRAGYQTIS